MSKCENENCFRFDKCTIKDTPEYCSILPSSYIPHSKCIEEHIYRVESRGAEVGVFLNGVFLIPTHSCGSVYLQEEYHFDTHPKHGTVKPYEDLGLPPKKMDQEELLKHLLEINTKLLNLNYHKFRKTKKK